MTLVSHYKSSRSASAHSFLSHSESKTEKMAYNALHALPPWLLRLHLLWLSSWLSPLQIHFSILGHTRAVLLAGHRYLHHSSLLPVFVKWLSPKSTLAVSLKTAPCLPTASTPDHLSWFYIFLIALNDFLLAYFTDLWCIFFVQLYISGIEMQLPITMFSIIGSFLL